jgi:hypothetical protein
VPHVVEREAGECERSARGHQKAADGRAPAGRERHRGGAGRRVARHRDREHAGREDAEQPGEDQVVRGVGERAGVAAVADVQRDVPVHAQQRDDQRHAGDGGRDRRPRGQAGDALGEAGELREPAGAAGAVADHEQREPAEDQHRGAGGDHDLVDGGAARRVGGRGGCSG